MYGKCNEMFSRYYTYSKYTIIIIDATTVKKKKKAQYKGQSYIKCKFKQIYFELIQLIYLFNFLKICFLFICATIFLTQLFIKKR